jgi:hypothetical protein
MNEVIDLINASDATDEQKKAAIDAFGVYKTEHNSKAEVAREDLTAELATANKTIKTLTRTSDELKKQVENSGGEVDQLVAEKQLEIDKLTRDIGERDTTINGYVETEAKTKLLDFSKGALKDSGLNFPRQHELFAEGLTPGTEEGKYFSKNKLGNTITAEEYKNNFLTEYKDFIIAKGTENGLSGVNTNTQTNSTNSNDKKPAPIKDLLPSEFN